MSTRRTGDALDAPLPGDTATERVLLGAMLIDPSRIGAVADVIDERDLLDAHHRIVYRHLLAMHRDGGPVDATLLAARLKASGQFDDVGGAATLYDLAQHGPTAANAVAYATAIKELARKRAIRHLGEELIVGAANGKSADELEAMLVRVNETRAKHGKHDDDGAGFAPVLVCAADVTPEPIDWLWEGRIPLRRVSMIVGYPGCGKSFFTIDAAARITTGTPWPDGRECPQGSVLLITAEDDPGDTIRPRLDAHYADVRRVHLLSAVRLDDRERPYERMITLADLDAIETALDCLADCRLVVVDPVGSFLGGRTDAHRDNEVRAVLAPIAALAAKHGPAVLVVAHRRKSAGTIADDLALGSRAFTGIARTVWHVSRDPKSKTRRLLLPGKNNLAAVVDGMAFSIGGEPARIRWERDPIAMTADDALAEENRHAARKPGPDADGVKAATAWLRTALAGGPRLARELADEWRNGQGGSERTLRRAREADGVDVYRPAVPGPWWWRLSDKVANMPEDGELGHLGHLAKNTGILPHFDDANPKVAKLEELGHLGPDGDFLDDVRTNEEVTL
jgi:hypothetical protein